MYQRFFLLLVSGVLLAGCAYERKALNAEIAAANSGQNLSQSGEPSRASTEQLLTGETFRVAVYSLRLSEAYKSIGDDAAASRDYVSAGVIVAAGAAALASSASVASEEVAKVLIGGLVLNEGVKYAKPEGAAEAFYSASESMSCITSGVAKYFSQPIGVRNLHANAVALWYIRRTEMLLRASLQKEVPDFSKVLERITDGQKRSDVEALVEGAAGPDKVELMRLELEACLSDGGDEGSDSVPDGNGASPGPTGGNASQNLGSAGSNQGVPNLPDIVVTDS